MSHIDPTSAPPCASELIGSPAHAPTPKLRTQVFALASLGVPHGQIAKSLGISSRDLRIHYYPELVGAAEFWALNFSPLSAKNPFTPGGVHVEQ